MAGKRRKKSRRKQRPLVRIFVTAAVIIAAWFVLSKTAYQCDHCGMLTFGAGYEPNLLIEAFGKEDRICENCAKEEHKELIALKMKTVDDFKLKIDWFNKSEAEQTEKDS